MMAGNHMYFSLQNYALFNCKTHQLILKQVDQINQRTLDLALDESLERHLFSATEFIDMVQYLNRQRDDTDTTEQLKHKIKPIHPWSEILLYR